MIIQRPKRITTQGVSQDSQEAVNSVGSSLNQFIEETYLAIMGKLTVTDNLDQRFQTVTLSVTSAGIPNVSVTMKADLNSKATGIVCIRSTGVTPVTSAPFVSYVQNNNIITINHVAGLVADTNYTLVLLIIGS